MKYICFIILMVWASPFIHYEKAENGITIMIDTSEVLQGRTISLCFSINNNNATQSMQKKR